MCFVLLCLASMCTSRGHGNAKTDPNHQHIQCSTGISKYTMNCVCVLCILLHMLMTVYSRYRGSCTTVEWKKKRMFGGCQSTTAQFFHSYNHSAKNVMDLTILLPEQYLTTQHQRTCDDRHKYGISNGHHQTLGSQSVHVNDATREFSMCLHSLYGRTCTKEEKKTKSERERMTERKSVHNKKINIRHTYALYWFKRAINCWLECICLVAWHKMPTTIKTIPNYKITSHHSHILVFFRCCVGIKQTRLAPTKLFEIDFDEIVFAVYTLFIWVLALTCPKRHFIDIYAIIWWCGRVMYSVERIGWRWFHFSFVCFVFGNYYSYCCGGAS